MSKSKTKASPKVVSFSKTNSDSQVKSEKPKNNEEVSSPKKPEIEKKAKKEIKSDGYPYFLRKLNVVAATKIGFKKSEGVNLSSFEEYRDFLVAKGVDETVFAEILNEFFAIKG